MAKRYEIADESWALIEDLFSTPRYSRQPRADDRVMLNGIFWVLCSGVAWRDVPERLVLDRRSINAFATGETQAPLTRCSSACMYGSTNRGLDWCADVGGLTPRQCAPPAPPAAQEKRGLEEPQDHALRRSRGGLTNKIHMLCDANGIPLRFLLSGGNASDINYAQPLLDGAHVPTQRGRFRKRYKGCL
jgi:transposase